MARPWRIRYAGAKYHVTVRGNGRREVFHNRFDYERFLEQLDEALELDAVLLYAYALMPNHFHLFIETPHGNVQRFMQRLNTAYSMYHRYRHSEPGHCFQGRYGAKLISGESYITALTRYIHLNAVKTAYFKKHSPQDTVRELERFPWSSYGGYIDSKRTEERIDYRWLGLMGCITLRGNRQRYRRYVEPFARNTDKEFAAAMEVSRYAIGDERFVAQVDSDLDDVRKNKGVYGDIVWPSRKQVSIADVSAAVAAEFGLDVAALRTRTYTARVAKKVALDLCCRYSGKSQRAVGEHFGYRGNGSVTKQRQRLRELLNDDNSLKRKLKKLERAVK